MKWLDKLKEYAPSIAGALLSGGATIPQLALKAVAEVLGAKVDNEAELGELVQSASPEIMLKIKQADNSFKISMSALSNELVATELGDVQDARKNHKHSNVPAVLCGVLTLGIMTFTAALFVMIIPESNERMVNMLFGTYLPVWLSTVAYWVGTTRSSANKDKLNK